MQIFHTWVQTKLFAKCTLYISKGNMDFVQMCHILVHFRNIMQKYELFVNHKNLYCYKTLAMFANISYLFCTIHKIELGFFFSDGVEFYRLCFCNRLQKHPCLSNLHKKDMSQSDKKIKMTKTTRIFRQQNFWCLSLLL